MHIEEGAQQPGNNGFLARFAQMPASETRIKPTRESLAQAERFAAELDFEAKRKQLENIPITASYIGQTMRLEGLSVAHVGPNRKERELGPVLEHYVIATPPAGELASVSTAARQINKIKLMSEMLKRLKENDTEHGKLIFTPRLDSMDVYVPQGSALEALLGAWESKRVTFWGC